MVRDILLPIIWLLIGTILTILVQQWKPRKIGRFLLLLLVGSLLVAALVLGIRVQDWLSGVLRPGSRTPMDPRQWGFTRVNPPAGSFKVLLGDSLFVTTDPSHAVLTIAGQEMVRVSVEKRRWPLAPRMTFSARVFDKTGKIVGKIKENRWEINPNNYFKKQATPHSITITDQYEAVFSAEFLNPDCVRILGTFHQAGRTVEAHTDRLILPGNVVIRRGYFAGSKTDISIE